MKIHFKFCSIRFWIGLIAACISFIISYSIGGSIPKCMILSATFVVVSLFKISVSGKWSCPIIILTLLLFSFATLFLSQFVLGEGLASVAPVCVVLGFCCCAILFGLLFLVLPNIRFCAVVGSGIVLLLATANHFVYTFRGTELNFIDFFSIRTAANVVSNYHFDIMQPMIYSWIIYLLLIYTLWGISFPKIARKSICYIIPLCVFGLCAAFFFGFSGRVQVLHFFNNGTYNNGYILNFALTIHEVFVEKPDNYSPDCAEQISKTYSTETASDNQQFPNIIVIMDESYSDLSVLGSAVNTDSEISPFISSLEENTIKGYALTSAFGGRTANAEFEFLTGMTMGFLPDGSIAFQQFIHDKNYSIISQLKSMGYHTVAMHPYLSNGWMRNTVWPKLGFDTCVFLDEFPQENLLRNLVSDQEMIDFIIDAYENRDSESPLFLFGVTMQNHSGYDYIGDDFETTVHLEGYNGDYPDAEQYLSLIHSTDRAIENLITYFETVEEPVVVLFYGDHLPALNQHFYEELHGGPFNSLDEQMLQYKIPFFVWTNYEIEERFVECTSLNYLSTYVYESAGLSLPGYNQFLKEMEKQIPAINMLGYYSVSEECFLPINRAEATELEWLNDYKVLQYNALFDEKNLCSMFTIN